MDQTRLSNNTNIRYLSDGLPQVVDKVTDWNAFFAHPNYVVFVKVVDKSDRIQELGYTKILKRRQTVAKQKTVRNVVPPKVNLAITSCQIN